MIGDRIKIQPAELSISIVILLKSEILCNFYERTTTCSKLLQNNFSAKGNNSENTNDFHITTDKAVHI